MLLAGILSGILGVASAGAARGEERADAAMAERIQTLIPALEAYVENGMKAFDVPGLAIGIVANDRLVYGKGFGVRAKGGAAVDPGTVFQIASVAKGFLAATLAIMVDRGKLNWDDRVIDRDAEFVLKDPWVTREFRVFDLLAQRSGLPEYANDALGRLGLLEGDGMIHSLRYVEPVSSFRSTFAYTNITHLVAGRIVAKAAGASDWDAVLRRELLEPLGMRSASTTAEAIEAAADHAQGHRWTPGNTIAVPFTPIFPYAIGGAGNINADLNDMARWVRLQLGAGEFEGRRIVSAENLAYTHTPKVAMSERLSYALGWMIQQTPNGRIVLHNGGSTSFGAYVGMAADRNVGVIVLTNAQNVGFPDALGEWTLDRLMGNPQVDHVAEKLKAATEGFEKAVKLFAKPAQARPFPDPAPLAGTFANAGIGKATVTMVDGALVLSFAATGARLKLEPWDGDIFTATLMPEGRFAAVAANNGPQPAGFAQFQMDHTGALNVLQLSFDNGQLYALRRE
jgi:CubicO group peptidase (beta-lactamase class C family)